MISLLNFEACGIDISDRAVKYVSLSRKGNRLQLSRYGEFYLADGAVMGGEVANPEVLVEALKKVKLELKLDYVVASLPEEKGYVVEMPMALGLGVKNVRDAVELHLEERVPISATSAIFDYEQGSAASATAGQSLLVTSVVENAVATKYYEALLAADLTPICFELESHSLARAVVKRGTTDVSMIVDIGREQSNLAIVAGEVVHLAASVNMGGDVMTKAIEDDLEVSRDEAKKLKEEVGLLRKDEGKRPFESIVRVASVLRDEVWQRLGYWNNGDSNLGKRSPVARIFLCGGNANIPGLSEYLTSDMGLPVASANPWVNIASFDEYIPPMTKQESLKYCAALGLALRATKNQ